LADSVNIGLVKLVRGTWNGKFIEEFRHFPFGARKDQVDAAADCYKRLSRKTRRRRPRSTSQSIFG
jgi:phage terminase large subunit-like protein